MSRTDSKPACYDRFLWQLAIASKFGPKKPPCRHVLLTLALDMSEAGDRAWPSQARLAERTGLNERVVRRLLALAAETGWILRTPRNRERGKNWKSTSYVAQIPDSFPRDELARLRKRLGFREDRQSAPSSMERTDFAVGEDKADGMVRTQGPTTSPNYFSHGTSDCLPNPKLAKEEMETKIRSAAARSHERPSFEKEHPDMAAIIHRRGWNYLGHANVDRELGFRINELLKQWSQAA